MLEHDYALLGGLNRAKVGRYLSLVAASVSAGIVFVLLAADHDVDELRSRENLGQPADLVQAFHGLDEQHIGPRFGEALRAFLRQGRCAAE